MIQHIKDDLIRYLLCNLKTLHLLYVQSQEKFKLLTAGIQFRILLIHLFRTGNSAVRYDISFLFSALINLYTEGIFISIIIPLIPVLYMPGFL